MSQRAFGTARRGLFIVFEGGEGSGKTTQAKRLALRLRHEGQEVVLTREPGGTRLAEEVRKLLLDDTECGMTAKTELFLYLAGRAEHVEKLIVPALQRGSTVVCDRFSLASIAYQGAGRRLGQSQVAELCDYATGGLWPDITFLLDMKPEVGLERKMRGDWKADRLERENLTFHRMVRDGYLTWAKNHPDSVSVLRADAPADVVESEIWGHVATLKRSRRKETA